MKFLALAALVATTQAADDASVATGSACTAGADKECKTATDSCCPVYASADARTSKTSTESKCAAAVTTDQTDGSFFGKDTCKGRTAAGAASLAATAAAAATALYAMC